MSVWERFDGIAKPEEVADAKSKFTPVPAGTYTMTLEEIEAGETMAGLPVLKSKFRTNENRVVFFNINLQNISNPDMTAVNISNAVDFLSDIRGDEVVFESLGKLADTINETPTGGQYSVKLYYNKKDEVMKYPQLKIGSAVVDTANLDDGDLPF